MQECAVSTPLGSMTGCKHGGCQDVMHDTPLTLDQMKAVHYDFIANIFIAGYVTLAALKNSHFDDYILDVQSVLLL